MILGCGIPRLQSFYFGDPTNTYTNPRGPEYIVEERAQSVKKWTATDNSHQTKAKMSFSIKSGVVTNLVQTSKALLSNSRFVSEDLACLYNYLQQAFFNTGHRKN